MSNLATIVNNILADSGIDDINVIVSTGSYANPVWITSLAWTKITGAPANIVTGTGTIGQVAYWSSGSAITGEANLFWDATNDRLGVGTNVPIMRLHTIGNSTDLGTISSQSVQEVLYSQPSNQVGGISHSFNTTNGDAYITSAQSNASLVFATRIAPSNFERWRITAAGIFQSNGAQTIQTSTGALALQPSNNVLIGTTTDSIAKLNVNGTSYISGGAAIGVSASLINSGPILTSTLTNGGSGYVDATYVDVAASSVAATFGIYALFTIVVSGGIVTTATLTWGGTAYRVGDTLTVSNTLLGGTGSGLIITVATVDSSELIIADSIGGDITLYRNDTSLSANDNIGSIKFEGRDSSSKSSGVYAKIGAGAAGTAGGAYLSFLTSAGAGGALTERLRLTSGGTVIFSNLGGVGTRMVVADANGLLSTQAITVGTVTSVAALTLGTTGTDLTSTVANGTTTPVITLNVPNASATNRGALTAADWTTFNSKQNALTNPVTGTGAVGQVAYFNGTSTITSEANLFWDATNNRLGIGTATPSVSLDVVGGYISAGTSSATNSSKILWGNYSNGALTTFGSSFSSGGPVVGYGVSPSTSAEFAFVSSTGITLSRGAYYITGGNHYWYAGASQTVAVDSAVTMANTMSLNASGVLTVGADVTLSAANPFVYGGTAVGSVGLSNIGGQTYVRVFGATHATTPNVTQFVNAGSTSLTISNTGNLALKAAATGSTATHVPVFIADPAATTQSLLTRTLQDFKFDVGSFIAKGVRSNAGDYTRTLDSVNDYSLWQDNFSWLSSYYATKIIIEAQTTGNITSTNTADKQLTIGWGISTDTDFNGESYCTVNVPLGTGVVDFNVIITGTITITSTSELKMVIQVQIASGNVISQNVMRMANVTTAAAMLNNAKNIAFTGKMNVTGTHTWSQRQTYLRLN